MFTPPILVLPFSKICELQKPSHPIQNIIWFLTMTAIYFLVNLKVESDSNISLYYVKYFLLAKMFVSCCEMHLFCRHSQSLHTSQLHNIQIQEIYSPATVLSCPPNDVSYQRILFDLFLALEAKKLNFPPIFNMLETSTLILYHCGEFWMVNTSFFT